jgi:hypothetical protein
VLIRWKRVNCFRFFICSPKKSNTNGKNATRK